MWGETRVGCRLNSCFNVDGKIRVYIRNSLCFYDISKRLRYE